MTGRSVNGAQDHAIHYANTPTLCGNGVPVSLTTTSAADVSCPDRRTRLYLPSKTTGAAEPTAFRGISLSPLGVPTHTIDGLDRVAAALERIAKAMEGA